MGKTDPTVSRPTCQATASATQMPRGHLTETAYQHVKALILNGRVKPGARQG